MNEVGAEVGGALEICELMADYGQQIKDAIRTFIREYDINVPINDEREYTIGKRDYKEIDVRAAWRHTMQALGDDADAMSQCVKLSMTGLRDQIAAKYDKGQRTAAMKTLMSTLLEDGSMNINRKNILQRTRRRKHVRNETGDVTCQEDRAHEADRPADAPGLAGH